MKGLQRHELTVNKGLNSCFLGKIFLYIYIFWIVDDARLLGHILGCTISTAEIYMTLKESGLKYTLGAQRWSVIRKKVFQIELK